MTDFRIISKAGKRQLEVDSYQSCSLCDGHGAPCIGGTHSNRRRRIPLVDVKNKEHWLAVFWRHHRIDYQIFRTQRDARSWLKHEEEWEHLVGIGTVRVGRVSKSPPEPDPIPCPQREYERELMAERHAECARVADTPPKWDEFSDWTAFSEDQSVSGWVVDRCSVTQTEARVKAHRHGVLFEGTYCLPSGKILGWSVEASTEGTRL